MNTSKLVYKPVGMLGGVVAGAAAAYAFSHLWRLWSDKEEPPRATDEDRTWAEILTAAMLQGAIFGVVKAAVDRATATGVRGVTGRWPG